MPTLQVPDTVNAGSPDTVVVWTSGGGCTGVVPPRVATDDLYVTIWLFDSVLVRGPDDVCPAVRDDYRRTAVVRFAHPGLARVRVIGSDTLDRLVVVR